MVTEEGISIALSEGNFTLRLWIHRRRVGFVDKVVGPISWYLKLLSTSQNHWEILLSSLNY